MKNMMITAGLNRHGMKMLRTCCLALCGWGAALASGSAAVIYTSVYDANALPTATAGTTANPLWALAGTSGTFSSSVNAGILSASTQTNVASFQYWAVGTSSGTTNYPGSTVGVWNTSTGTIDFRLQVTEALGGAGTTTAPYRGGFMIQVTDKTAGTNFYTFYIGTGGFTYTNTASTGLNVEGASIGIDPTQFNTYRIALDAGKASLYVQGVTAPIFSMVFGVSAGSTRNAILFGDISASASGTFNLDYLDWSNSVADFSSPIPEPAPTALLAAAALGGVIWTARRRSAL